MEVIARKEEKNYKTVVDELAKTKDGEKLDSQKFWRIKKKICSRSKDPPSVMFDDKGNIRSVCSKNKKQYYSATPQGFGDTYKRTV